MGERVPGPVCSARAGDDWIDYGTNCRTRSAKPGPSGTGELIRVAARYFSPAKAKFDKDHVYSRAPEAARKRDIDLQIIGDDYNRSADISLTNADYLRQLVFLGSRGAQSVKTDAKKIQFFIVRGGAEGFLRPGMAKQDASRVAVGGTTTGGKSSPAFIFDNNDLLAVFDAKGGLIGASLLERPLSIPGAWTERTANKVYNAWHNKSVSIYRNTNFDIPYLGLVVSDGMKKTAWVDLHKQEATNGCIFIVDPNTPDLDQPALHDFEPKLIVDTLAAIGKKPKDVKGAIHLGMMRVVNIK